LLARHAGVAVLSVDYRLAPEHRFPAAVDDAAAAFAWAAEHAGELGADAGRIGVAGDSAGGNLAAAVCLGARDSGGAAPAFQLLIYPAVDLTRRRPSRDLFADGLQLTDTDIEWYRRQYLPDEADLQNPLASPLLAESLEGLPPAHVATAGFDPLRDEGEDYARALTAAGVSATLRRHEGLVHGFANYTRVVPAAREAMLETAEALRRGLRA
jgi:acetyl esterase